MASRHPERTGALFESINADINDDRSVIAAVAGVEGVLNAVSLYVEKTQTSLIPFPTSIRRP